MTDEERLFLKESVDRVVVLEIAGETVLAQVLFVFDEADTPDVFYLEMRRADDGTLTPVGKNGFSSLLAEITAVRPYMEA